MTSLVVHSLISGQCYEIFFFFLFKNIIYLLRSLGRNILETKLNLFYILGEKINKCIQLSEFCKFVYMYSYTSVHEDIFFFTLFCQVLIIRNTLIYLVYPRSLSYHFPDRPSWKICDYQFYIHVVVFLFVVLKFSNDVSKNIFETLFPTTSIIHIILILSVIHIILAVIKAHAKSIIVIYIYNYIFSPASCLSSVNLY